MDDNTSFFIPPKDLNNLMKIFGDFNKNIKTLMDKYDEFFKTIQFTLKKQELRLNTASLIPIINALDEFDNKLEKYLQKGDQQEKKFTDIIDELLQKQDNIPFYLQDALREHAQLINAQQNGNLIAALKEMRLLNNGLKAYLYKQLLAINNKIEEVGKSLVQNNMNILKTLWKQTKEFVAERRQLELEKQAEIYKEAIYSLAQRLAPIIYRIESYLQIFKPIPQYIAGIYKAVASSPLGGLIKGLFQITFALPYLIAKTLGLEPILKRSIASGVSLLKIALSSLFNDLLKAFLKSKLGGTQKKKTPSVITTEGEETETTEEIEKEAEKKGWLSNITHFILNFFSTALKYLSKGLLIAFSLFPLLKLDQLLDHKLIPELAKLIFKIIWFIIKEAFKTLIDEILHGTWIIGTSVIFGVLLKTGLTKLLSKVIGEAIGKLLTSLLGKMAVGATIGSIAPGIGTVLGAIASLLLSILIDLVLKYVYKGIKSLFSKKKKESVEENLTEESYNTTHQKAAIGKLFKKPAITQVAEREPELVIPVPKLEQLINKEIEREKIIQQQKRNIVYLKPMQIIHSQMQKTSHILNPPTIKKEYEKLPAPPPKIENKISIKEIEKTNNLLNEILYLIKTKEITITVENKVNIQEETENKPTTKKIKAKIL